MNDSNSLFPWMAEGEGQEDQVMMTDIFASLVLVLLMMVGGDPDLLQGAPDLASDRPDAEQAEPLRLYVRPDGALAEGSPRGEAANPQQLVRRLGLAAEALAARPVEVVYPREMPAGLVHQALAELHRAGLVNTSLGLAEYAQPQRPGEHP